ncbi:MAG: succinylglutamate desuccinylase/aspartoacylase family protein [Rhodospirillales bacterium]
MAYRSRISPSIDFDAPGKHWGYLDLAHSTDRSAWGTLRIPVAVASGGANGSGPTLLVTGGNHGDEYEGQIAAMNLMRSIDPDAMQGRVIIIPFLNMPAVLAGKRTSPIDGGNMNRVFPGNPDGTVTEQIADFVTQVILPLADTVIDIHSGGRTLMFEPFACIHNLDDRTQFEVAKETLMAFAAPISLVLTELDSRGMLDTTVEDLGKTFISTELGGGGTATASTVRIAAHGLERVMEYMGIAEASPQAKQTPPTRFMDTGAEGAFTRSDDEGVLEMLADLGDWVMAGQPLGRVHDIRRPEREPAMYHAATDGLLIGRHHPGLVSFGDCFAVQAQDAA